MAGSSNTIIYTIKVTNDQHYGWTGPEYAYKDLAGDLGVTITQPGKKPPNGTVMYGKVKPPKVRMRSSKGKSFIRYIDSDKIEDAIHKGGLVGKKTKDKQGASHDICFASIKSN